MRDARSTATGTATGTSGEGLLGLRYLKFVAVLVMIQVHCIVWITRAAGKDFSGSLDDTILGLWPLMIPATAGAIFRVSLDRHFVGGRLLNFPMRKAVSLFFALALVESTKGALVYRASTFFSWNVLHFTGLSLLIILLLARHSVRLVAGAAALTLALTLPLRKALDPLLAAAPHEFLELAARDYVRPRLMALTALAACTAIAVLIRRGRQGPVRAPVLAGLVTVTAASFLWLALRISVFETTDLSFAPKLHNLPLAVLVGDPNDFHIWPLFPWFSVVAAGFWVYDAFLRASDRRTFRTGLFAASAALLTGFLLFSYDDFRAAVDLRSLWSPEIFRPGPGLVAGVLGAFGLQALLCDQLERRGNIPGLRLMSSYGRAILWIYLLITSIGVFLAELFSRYLQYRAALVVFPLLMHLISLGIALLMERNLGRKSLRILVSKG